MLPIRNAIRTLIVVGTMIACSSEEQETIITDIYGVYIDPAMSDKEVNSFNQALIAWETMLDGKLIISSIEFAKCPESNYNRICAISTTAADINAKGVNPEEVGYTAWNVAEGKGNIYIPSDKDADMSMEEMTLIMAHELGHAMGLEHTQTGTVMCYTTACAAGLPTCDDEAQWSWVHHKEENLNCPNGGEFYYQN